MRQLPALVLALLTTGCTVIPPKRPPYRRLEQLLGECREHVRLLKECEKMDCSAAPEQKAGGAEWGLAEW